jgi:hypothetical protein
MVKQHSKKSRRRIRKLCNADSELEPGGVMYMTEDVHDAKEMFWVVKDFDRVSFILC